MIFVYDYGNGKTSLLNRTANVSKSVPSAGKLECFHVHGLCFQKNLHMEHEGDIFDIIEDYLE